MFSFQINAKMDLTTECVKCSKWHEYKLPKDRVQSTVEVVGRQKEEKSRDKENVVGEQIPGEIEKTKFCQQTVGKKRHSKRGI